MNSHGSAPWGPPTGPLWIMGRYVQRAALWEATMHWERMTGHSEKAEAERLERGLGTINALVLTERAQLPRSRL